MLGDLLARLTDEIAAVETLLQLGDLRLLETARGKAAAEGLNLATYVTQAVQRYAIEASDEEWVTLMGLLNRSPDPGTTCLNRALEHALRG
jgi:hypothetical protein